MTQELNFIESYLDFYEGTEPPTIFNRWCCIAGLGALLGRQTWIQHGHTKIYPNQYIMLVGESGTRKSTAIKTFLKPLLNDAGYKTIAASKTSKEKFLADLEEGMDKVNDPDEQFDIGKIAPTKSRRSGPDRTMREIFGAKDTSEPSECLVMSDDSNVFLGHSNIEFIELLTDLWDYEGIYSSRIKTGRSILVPNPTLSMLLGNTQVGISLSFPIEVIGQGFFSRLISVYSDPSGIRITFPPPPDLVKRKLLVEALMRIRHNFRGPIEIEPFAVMALDDIYQHWKEIDDVRFRSYSTRRFTHLLKLSLCVAAAKEERIINTRTVEYANSILHYTESFMPKALGEFGKARNSDISAKIMEILERKENLDAGGLNVIEGLWPLVSRDLESTQELARVVKGLQDAGKIQQSQRGKLLPVKKKITFDFPHCKVSLLREYIKQREEDGLPI
jgi:hypothetical protein